MSPSGTRQRPLESLRQFTVTQSGHALGNAEIRSVGFMAIGKAGAPFAESARCSLLGEAERLAVGQSLRKAPKLLVQPDIAVQARDRAGAREAFPIRAAACLIF